MKYFQQFLCISLFLFISINAANAQKREFSNLKRYEEANKNLPEPGLNENRVVFLGNSITDSWSTDFFEKNKSYINRGISGQTTPQMLIRFREDVINLKPKALVLLAGTNDIAGNTGPSTLEMITNNIKSMCELAVANEIEVILCSVLPANVFPWSKGIEPADSIIELNQRLKKYAAKQDFVYVDYYSAMVDEEKGLKSIYANDPVHPNEEGYKVMEVLVEKAIKKTLGKS